MLSENWITENHVDFEFKKYQLLGYLQKVKLRFDKIELFPHLTQVNTHHCSLQQLKTQKHEVQQSFSQELVEVDLRKKELRYLSSVKLREEMQELSHIIDYALPKLEHYVNAGKKIYQKVKNNLLIEPIGLVPLYKKEGYLLLKPKTKKETSVHKYTVSLFNNQQTAYPVIKTSFITTYIYGISNSFEQMKANLIRYQPELPNPAVYVVESKLEYPFFSTFLPVTERVVAKHLSQNEEA